MSEPASKTPMNKAPTNKTSKNKTLYVVQLNFPRGLEAISNRRFDYEHVPDLLSCDGFVGLDRFHLADIEPTQWPRAPRRIEYMNLWQLEGPEVLASEAYRLRSNGPDPSWQGRTNQHRYHALRERQRKMEGLPAPAPQVGPRRVWDRRPMPWLRPHGATMPPPRSVFAVFYDVALTHEDEVNAVMDEETVPELLGCPGFLGCERYTAVDVPLGPGHTTARNEPITAVQHMDIYDLTSIEVMLSDEYCAQRDNPSARAQRIEPLMTLVERGVFYQRSSPWAITANPGNP